MYHRVSFDIILIKSARIIHTRDLTTSRMSILLRKICPRDHGQRTLSCVIEVQRIRPEDSITVFTGEV